MAVMRPLEPGDPGVVNHKSPTSLLLDPDGEFHSFGFRARDFYHDLSPKEAKNWLYFDKFKMPLHNAKVGYHTLLSFHRFWCNDIYKYCRFMNSDHISSAFKRRIHCYFNGD